MGHTAGRTKSNAAPAGAAAACLGGVGPLVGAGQQVGPGLPRGGRTGAMQAGGVWSCSRPQVVPLCWSCYAQCGISWFVTAGGRVIRLWALRVPGESVQCQIMQRSGELSVTAPFSAGRTLSGQATSQSRRRHHTVLCQVILTVCQTILTDRLDGSSSAAGSSGLSLPREAAARSEPDRRLSRSLATSWWRYRKSPRLVHGRLSRDLRWSGKRSASGSRKSIKSMSAT